MIPLLNFPLLIDQYGSYFEDLFTAGEYGQFRRYLSGLLLSENKTVEGMNRLFVRQPQNQSSLNRFLTASSYDIAQVNERRLSWLQDCRRTRFKQGRLSHRGVLIIDDTLLKHVGKHFEHIAYLYDHVEKRYVWAHNLVNLHYSDDHLDYPVHFQLWKPADPPELVEALVDSGVKVRHKEAPAEEDKAKTWRKSLLRLANKHQDKPKVRAAYRTKLTIAQELIRHFYQAYPDANMPLVFDSWYTAPWFCRWLNRDRKKAYVGVLSPDEEVFRQENQFCRLDDLAEELKAKHLVEPGQKLFTPISIQYKGRQKTYYTYCRVHSIRNFGRHRLVVNYRQEDLSDDPAFFICNRLKWEARAITRIYRHRWPVEVYHEEGKAEGLEQYQVRGFEAIHKHIAFIALAYSMLQRARFDTALADRLQKELDQKVQGSLAFWRRALKAHAFSAILLWIAQAVLQGEDYLPLWKNMTQAIAYQL